MSKEKDENLPEGRLKEISVQASVGGKMQIVKYQFSADYHYSFSQKYEVDDLTPYEATKFREAKIKEIREHLEEIGDAEITELTELRKQLNEEEEYE